jgi:hypothetical protein
MTVERYGWYATNGDLWHPRWTTSSGGGTGTIDIQSNAGRLLTPATSGFGGSARAAGGRYITDGEILARITPLQVWTTLAFFTIGFGEGFFVANNNFADGYRVSIEGNADEVYLERDLASSSTTLAGPGTFDAGAGTAPVWVRFRKVGRAVAAKLWLDGNPEPADWLLTAVDTAGPTIPFRTQMGANTGSAATAVGWTIDYLDVNDFASPTSLLLATVLSGGPVALDGATSLTTGNTSALAVTRALGGTAALTIVTTGQTATAAGLAGSTSLTTSPAAVVAVGAALGATTSITTAVVAVIARAVPLAATASLTTASSATLGVAVSLTGTCSLTTGASADVSRAVPLAASTTATTAVTADIAVARPLAGSTTITTAVTVAAAVQTALTGSTSLTTTASASFPGDVPLAAACGLTTTVTGTLAVAVRFAGSTQLVTGGTALLAELLRLSTTTALAFLTTADLTTGSGVPDVNATSVTTVGSLTGSTVAVRPNPGVTRVGALAGSTSRSSD